MSRCFVEVSLPPPLARELTYGVPPELKDEVCVGSVVQVPVRQRLMRGIVVARTRNSAPAELADEEIRDLSQLVAGDALLDEEIIELCRWMADYYFTELGTVLSFALPPGLQLASGRLVRLVDRAPPPPEPTCPLEAQILAQLRTCGSLKVTTLERRLGRRGLEEALRRLRRATWVEIAPFMKSAPVRCESHVGLSDVHQARAALPQLERRAPRQAACVRRLVEQGILPRKSLRAQGFTAALLRVLHKRGLVEFCQREVLRDPLAHIDSPAPEALRPTAEQQQVIEALGGALDAGKFYPALLQGVTGSGKTLVYIQAVARALRQGRGAIVLVPEIALAWQVVRHFKSHFGDQVTVLHSQLSAGERYDTWRRLRRGEQRLVIGARSAIFAPVRKLGIVVVDEEHDQAYKQENLEGEHPLFYNARDLALVRGRGAGAVVLLGSATPSLETYWNAHRRKYRLLRLPRRIDDRPLPQVEVVDMRREPYQRKQRAIFSHDLRLKMRQRLERGEQIILLQNRRGFAPTLVCSSCGEAVLCKSCRICLTYHRAPTSHMRCHYCDYRAPVPALCPHCGAAGLRFEGIGTQKVQEALLEQFPGVRVLRMDIDTTGGKSAHDELVEAFRRGEAEVLLGTQMVAKGLDFPRVTLVGVISADTGLHLPDFRATERSFQLLTQVAGRSGRGTTPGEVVVQTHLPEEPVLRAAAHQDFEAFAGPELEERRQAGFPPFGRLIVFRWRGPDEEAVERAAAEGAAHLRRFQGAAAEVLGPAPAPLARLRNHYRWQALLRGPNARALHRVVARALPALRAAERAVQMQVNVDPLTIM